MFVQCFHAASLGNEVFDSGQGTVSDFFFLVHLTYLGLIIVLLITASALMCRHRSGLSFRDVVSQ